MSTNRAGWPPGVVLDWREHHAGPPEPCRLCGRPAICRDIGNRPCHKVCAEQHDARPVNPGRADPSTLDMREPIPMPRTETLLTAALACAERGWHVFPLRPGDKRPAIDRWEQRASTDLGRIRRCWAAGPYNVGIACGPSGLAVVDLDRPKPGQQPPAAWADPPCRDGADVFGLLCARHDSDGAPEAYATHTVSTGSGGTHLYYQHTAGPELRNTAGTLGWLVDTRAHGGYVVAAGSIVNGRPYTVINGHDPAELPGWLAELLRPAPLRPAGPPLVIDLPADRRGAYVRGAITRTLAKLAEAGEGIRNDTLFMGAQTLGQLVAGGMVPADTVTDVLTDAARRIGLRDAEIARTIRSGLEIGARRPRTVAA